MAEEERWNREGLPPWIRRLDLYETEDTIDRFWRLCRVRLAPSVEEPCREMFWPRKGVEARAIPEGIHPLDAECGFDHDVKLERFFGRFSPVGIIAWGHGRGHQGCFAGPYNEEMRTWMSLNLVSNSICVLGTDTDVLLVTDQVLRFSIIMSSSEVISGLEECFGGRKALEAEFRRHVDVGDLGFGRYDQQWARDFLLPMSGWLPTGV